MPSDASMSAATTAIVASAMPPLPPVHPVPVRTLEATNDQMMTLALRHLTSDDTATSARINSNAAVLQSLMDALRATARLKLAVPAHLTGALANTTARANAVQVDASEAATDETQRQCKTVTTGDDDPLRLIEAIERNVSDALRSIQATFSASSTADGASIGVNGAADAFGSSRTTEQLFSAAGVDDSSSRMMVSFCSDMNPLGPSGPSTPDHHRAPHVPITGTILPNNGASVVYDHVPDGNIADWLNEAFAPSQRRRRTLGTSTRVPVVVSSLGTSIAVPPIHGSSSASVLPVAASASKSSSDAIRSVGAAVGVPTQQPIQDRKTVGDLSMASTSQSVAAAHEVKFVRSLERPIPAVHSATETALILKRCNVPFLDDVDSPDFNVISAFADCPPPSDALVVVAANVFARYSFMSTLALDLPRFIAFLSVLCTAYRADNPYHNAMHAADVLQTVHIFLTVNDMRENFTDVELLALLFAAVVHDVGHVGVNNAFLQNIRHPLAKLFNDQSVLESAHAAAAFALLERDGCNFFPQVANTESSPEAEGSDAFTRDMFDDFRVVVVECLLATDMKHHSEQTAMIRGILKDGRILDGEIHKLLRSILHVADISNPMKPFDTYVAWVTRVLAEFWMQGDAEVARGMKVSLLCDRHTTAVGKPQNGFIQFVVRPFADEMAVIMPSVWLRRLHDNAERMKALPADEESAILARVKELIGDRHWMDGSDGSAHQKGHVGLIEILRDGILQSSADTTYVKHPGAFARTRTAGSVTCAPANTSHSSTTAAPHDRQRTTPTVDLHPSAVGTLPPLRVPHVPATARRESDPPSTVVSTPRVSVNGRRQLRDVVPTPAWMSMLASPRR